MEDGQERSHANWRQLAFEWQQAQQGWRDRTTEYFRGRFQDPLEDEMKNYLQAVDSLVEILRKAQEEARHR